jgi:nitrite reductase (NADH) large subunit
VVERDVHGAYDRFDLPRVLRGDAHATEIVRYDARWFAARGVELHQRNKVHLIDRFRRKVQAEGLSLSYDKLILAMGSGPYLPSIRNLLQPDGSLHRGVHVFRTLDDCDALAAAAGAVKRVAVLGGGRLGVEIGAALAARCPEVQLFHQGARLMSSQLDFTAATMLKTKLESTGARVQLGKRAVAIHAEGEQRRLEFQDGSSFECDIVVLATGFQPDTWLAYQCGLTVERGVVVEGRMRSLDDFNVHALGECAQWRGSIHALPEQINKQAEVIAEHLTSQHADARYVGFKQASLYSVMGLNMTTMGSPERRSDDDVVQLGEPGRGRYKKLVLRDSRLVSGILLGDVSQAARLSRLYGSSAPLTHDERQRLFELCLPVEERSATDHALPPPLPTDPH